MKKEFRPKILIIDDEADFCWFVKFNLDSTGECRVVTSTDGSDGIKKIVREKPDLILLDIMMPGKDGLYILQAIKESPHTASIPVIILTALEQEKPMRMASELFADGYLVKPVSTGQLIAAIFNLLPQRTDMGPGSFY